MSKVRLILQARLNSSRLPGKMLLPIGNIPLVVLCAQRAMCSGHELTVATSNTRFDDKMAEVLEQNQIEYIRGDLDDVLSRFILASEDMNSKDLIVRLTGDNPFVDGAFINSLLEFHNSHSKPYTRTLSPEDGFPYGLSAEVIEVGKLRALAGSNPTAEQKEHVTLAATESGEYELYKNEAEDLSSLRVTVDTFEDYIRARRTFAHINKSPLNVSWQDLITTLKNLPEATETCTDYIPKSKLALGTVQLGLNYGVANKYGKPDTTKAMEIVSKAISEGIDILDTASAYGESEAILGRVGHDHPDPALICTKLNPLNELNGQSSIEDFRYAVQTSIYSSLGNLGLTCLPVLMLHRWEHFNFKDGAIWQILLEMQGQGLIHKLGASVQSPEEALEAIEHTKIKFIQLPYNILDYRWQNSGFIDAIKQRSDIHIQARSSLLQGVVTLPADRWPLEQTLAGRAVDQLESIMKASNRESIIDLCYAFVRSQGWISSVVVGLETLEQLNKNIELFKNKPLEDCTNIQKEFEFLPKEFLNPANWNKN